MSNSSNAAPNTDLELERAMAAEACFDFVRYQTFGITLDDYFSVECRAVVEAAERVASERHRVDVESVATELQRAGKLVRLGGVDGFKTLLRSSAAPDADQLRTLRRLRELRTAALAAVAAAERGDYHGALELLSEAGGKSVSLVGVDRPIDANDLGCALVEQMLQGTRVTKQVHPGLELLERATGLIPLGSMVVVGGATNTGKSSFTLALLMAAASRNVTCGYVSCEDSADVLSSRLLSALTDVSSRRLATGSIDRDEFSRVADACERTLRGKFAKKLWFSFCVGGNEMDVLSAISKQAALGCRMVVVDYVQAIESSKRQQDRRNEIRWLSTRIKAHAQRLGVVLVLVSQLSRPPKGEEQREPTKHDLKEAGDLENAAEYVLLLWRSKEDDSAPVHVKMAKSKFGGIGARWDMQRKGKGAVLHEVEGSFKERAE